MPCLTSKSLPLVAVFAVLSAASSICASEPLRWKFHAGDVHNYQLDQTTTTKMDLGQGSVESHFHQIIDWMWKVEKVASDGSATLSQKIERVKINIDVPGGQSAEFDSASEKPAEGFGATLAPLMKAMTAAPFTSTMSARGEMTDLKIPPETAAALKNAPGAAALGDLATAEGFKKAVSQASLVLPEKLDEGAEWTTTTVTKNPNFGVATVSITYRYVGPHEENGVVLEVFKPTVSTKFSDSPVPIEVTGEESTGEVLFNRTAGRLEKSAVKIGTDLKYKAGTQEITVKTDQNVEMKRAADGSP